MAEEKGPVLPLGSFLFPRVFQAFRMSIQPTKLILALLALASICLVGRIMDVTQTVVVKDGATELDEYVSVGEVGEHIRLFGDFGRRDRDSGERAGVFGTLWKFGAERFHAAVLSIGQGDGLGVVYSIVASFQALVWAFTYHPLYSIIFFAIALVVMSLAGGAICRIAALQFAQGEKPGLTQAVRFSIKKWYSFVTAPITPIGIIAVIGVSIILLGLVGNIPVVGELAVGVFLPLALLAAALIAIIVIGALAGFNLMFPTIAYEDSDCFDAISRSFSYVYAKPWRMGFYTAIALAYGAICYEFVRFFCFLLVWLTHLFLQFGFLNHNEKLMAIWPEPRFTDFFGAAAAAPANWSTSVGVFLIHVWVLVVVGLMVSFVISFYFSANTIIYALMRNRVDKTALTEVCTHSGEPMTGPAPSAPASEEVSTPPQADDEGDSRQEAEKPE
jgi:hypothetical protein